MGGLFINQTLYARMFADALKQEWQGGRGYDEIAEERRQPVPRGDGNEWTTGCARCNGRSRRLRRTSNCCGAAACMRISTTCSCRRPRWMKRNVSEYVGSSAGSRITPRGGGMDWRA